MKILKVVQRNSFCIIVTYWVIKTPFTHAKNIGTARQFLAPC